MKTYNGSGKISSALAEVGNNVSSEVDFSNAGALKQTGTKVMTVTSSTDGRIYLKSMHMQITKTTNGLYLPMSRQTTIRRIIDPLL